MKFGFITEAEDPETFQTRGQQNGASSASDLGGAALADGERSLTLGRETHTVSSGVIGIELGDSVVRAALVEAGVVKKECVLDAPADSLPQDIIALFSRAVTTLDPKPSAVGLAVPGEIDENGRCWGISGAPGFEGVHVAEELAALLGCPVSIESEGFSAALCEKLHGHGQAHAGCLTVVLGQRLSAGLALHGELHRGSSGFGASLGHLPIDLTPAARPCECGRRGCLEQYAGLRALGREYEARTGAPASTHEIVERAAAQEEAALSALTSLGHALGHGIALVQNILDLDAVVLVCESPALFRALQPHLRERLRELVFGPPASEVPLYGSRLGPDAVIVGAADLAARIGQP